MDDLIIGATELDRLEAAAIAEKLTPPEMVRIGLALRYYRSAAIRTEKGIRTVVKGWENMTKEERLERCR